MVSNNGWPLLSCCYPRHIHPGLLPFQWNSTYTHLYAVFRCVVAGFCAIELTSSSGWAESNRIQSNHFFFFLTFSQKNAKLSIRQLQHSTQMAKITRAKEENYDDQRVLTRGGNFGWKYMKTSLITWGPHMAVEISWFRGVWGWLTKQILSNRGTVKFMQEFENKLISIRDSFPSPQACIQLDFKAMAAVDVLLFGPSMHGSAKAIYPLRRWCDW